MSDSEPIERDQPDEAVTKQVREGLEQAEAGETGGAERLGDIGEKDPTAVEAVEQEVSDGPAGRGQAR